MTEQPLLIKGGIHNDHRGELSYVNEFDLHDVRRFYVIKHLDTATVRAWQAHKYERKWFYVTKGSFKIVVVEPDNWEIPSINLGTKEIDLNDETSDVLYLPGGFANGFKALEPDSKMVIYSDLTVDESLTDDYRFDQNLWFNWDNLK